MPPFTKHLSSQFITIMYQLYLRGLKMRTKIIIGSLLAVLILMILPSIPAVEFDAVEKANESRLPNILKNADVQELKEKLKDSPAQPQFIGIIGIILGIILGSLKRFTVSIAIAMIGMLLALASMLLRCIAGIFKLAIIGATIIALVIFGINVMGHEDDSPFIN
jgi:hypothetical protein